MAQRERCVVCDELGWYDQYIIATTEKGRRPFGGISHRKICDDCAKNPPVTLTLSVTLGRVNRSPENQAYFDARRRGEHPREPWADEYEYDY